MEQERFIKELVPMREQLLKQAKRFFADPAEAEDIIQEVYLKLWFARDTLDRYNNLSGVAMQATKNLCLNRLKVMERTATQTDNLQIECTDNNPHIQLEQKDSINRAMHIVTKLPELQQAILRMKHLEGYEVNEIAAITGSTPEAVRVSLSRARRRIKELFLKTEV